MILVKLAKQVSNLQIRHLLGASINLVLMCGELTLKQSWLLDFIVLIT